MMARIGKKQLEKLQKKYKTDEAVAKLYGLTRQGIHRLRKKYAIPSISDKNSERNQIIKRLKTQGHSAVALAKKYSISTTQVYRILNDS